MESHCIRLHYLDEVRRYPADFLLAASMNLCPCGLYPDMERCTCHPHAVRRYQTRLGNPLVERFDLCLMLNPVADTETHRYTETDITHLLERIRHASETQRHRFQNEPFIHNSRIPASHIDQYCQLSSAAQDMFQQASVTWALSMRSQHNIKKTARSIADLADHELIELADIMEALQYRPRGLLNMDSNTGD